MRQPLVTAERGLRWKPIFLTGAASDRVPRACCRHHEALPVGPEPSSSACGGPIRCAFKRREEYSCNPRWSRPSASALHVGGAFYASAVCGRPGHQPPYPRPHPSMHQLSMMAAVPPAVPPGLEQGRRSRPARETCSIRSQCTFHMQSGLQHRNGWCLRAHWCHPWPCCVPAAVQGRRTRS